MIGHDVTEGAADRIVLAADDDMARERDARSAAAPKSAREGRAPDRASAASTDNADDRRGPAHDLFAQPLPGAPYDLVVGDLFYSQLLYPALLDLDVAEARRAATLAEHGPGLTRAVVARLHASAPRVVHVHDPLAWWEGHEQTVALADILDLAAAEGPDAALRLVARGLGPTDSDPRIALADLGLAPAATALWRWPFAPGVDYLACATLASTDGASSTARTE